MAQGALAHISHSSPMMWSSASLGLDPGQDHSITVMR